MTGVPQHVLRFWETKFDRLRPVKRAGNRRYYRPDDVALVREIDRLLNVDGLTVRGAQKLLGGGGASTRPADAPAPPPLAVDDVRRELIAIRDRLAAALNG